MRPLVDRVEQELRGPFHFFDAIYCINLDHETGRWESVMRQCKALGIDHRIRRFAAIDTPTSRGIGRALSHRAIVAEAKWQGLDNVLVLEDDVVFSRRTADVLAQSLAELREREWRLLSLGASCGDRAFPGASGDRFLQTAQGSMSLHAVAYHHTVYDQILTEVPATPTGMARWLQTHLGDRPLLCRSARRHEPGDVPLDRHSALPAPARGRAVRAAGGALVTGRARGFRVSLFGVHLDVVGDSAATVEALDRYVMPWLPREPVGAAAADGLVEVRRAGDGDGLEILVDGAVAGAAPSPLTAIPRVQRALDEMWVRCQADVAVVHGGVVAHDGRAILLPGPTHAGKSTLVAELVRRGAPYFSDEYALIDADGRVHPYPRPLLLRDGSGYDQPRLATELGGTVAHEPLPAGLIVGLRYAPDASPFTQAISQAEGVLLLLRNTPQVLVDQPWILTPLERAVGDAACYAGLRGEARETAAAILQLASSVTRGDAGRWPSGACCSTSAGSIPGP